MRETYEIAVTARQMTGAPTADPLAGGLRRELGRLDTVLMLVAAIVVLDTLGAVAVGGAQAFTWLAVAAVAFFLPAALIVSELGSTFPDEGGPYVWTKLAFGRLAGSLTAFFYWIEAPVWLGGSLTITAVTVVGEFFTPLHGLWRYAFALAFIWLAVAVAAAPLRLGKRVPASGAATQFALLGFFTVSVAIYAARNGVHGFGLSDFSPTWGVFLAIAPVLVYNLVGFEIPSNAAGEMRDPQHDVPASIARAGIWTVVLYCIPILAILLVLPISEITSLRGFIDAMKAVFTVYGGNVSPGGAVTLSGAGQVLGGIAAAGFVWVIFANGLTWIMGASRGLTVACLDGAGPRALGRVSPRTGTPIRVCVVSGAVATVVAVLGFALSGGDGQKYFVAVLSLSIALIAIGNLAVFPSLVRLRHVRGADHRPFRIPAGRVGAWTCSLLATAWVIVALVAVVWPGLGGGAGLPEGFEGRRLEFELTQLVPLLLLAGAGLAFFAAGRRRPHPLESTMLLRAGDSP